MRKSTKRDSTITQPSGQTAEQVAALERELFAGLSKVKWPVVLEDKDFEPRKQN